MDRRMLNIVDLKAPIVKTPRRTHGDHALGFQEIGR
jgi:hypothetical protein